MPGSGRARVCTRLLCGLHDVSTVPAQANLDRFCNTFNTIIPIQRLIPPLGAFTDPFLRGCMLDYVDSANRTPSPPTAYSRRLASLLSHNLAQIPCANPTLSIILGLLILSLRPLKTGDLRFARKMDEEGFIGRAMEFAVAYGLEDSALRASKETMKDLLSDSFGPLMDHTLLVSVQYC